MPTQNIHTSIYKLEFKSTPYVVFIWKKSGNLEESYQRKTYDVIMTFLVCHLSDLLYISGPKTGNAERRQIEERWNTSRNLASTPLFCDIYLP